ncbi:vomeronasal 1 receptor ornAnaV1R3248 [Ornithorhynchus anatinus]|uniref:vomeronasal 1 receptor ornAnaV1R3248 n=1 Tax=Ornithorhynchus anatinus TaxID=9258 RepID=UPI000155C3DF|nr:vomeronasal 1 receptor ornAnaV1R3248 [Ornithorhynchus anatinus]
MDASDISFGVAILLQISIGFSGNAFILLFYACLVSARQKFCSLDWILTHLALANTIRLLASGIPETLSAWGLRNFLDDVGCKILLYLHRVARGLAICTTSFLSIFQAITISPDTSRWARIKAKLTKSILPSCLLSWILNMLIDTSTLIFVTGPRNSTSVRLIYDLKYCSIGVHSAEAGLINSVVVSLRDMFFVGLMSGASGYMVFVLHSHHRQVQHLYGSNHSHRAMPEIRAAKRVIGLVALYVILYGRQSIMLSVLMNMKENSPLLVTIHVVLSPTFSTISPFLIILSDKRMRTFWKRKSPISNTVLSVKHMK